MLEAAAPVEGVVSRVFFTLPLCVRGRTADRRARARMCPTGARAAVLPQQVVPQDGRGRGDPGAREGSESR